MRTTIPNRRENETVAGDWRGVPLTVTVGYDKSGAVREIFVDYSKRGDMQSIMADAFVGFSHLLQSGRTIKDLQQMVGRDPVDPRDPAASVIGHVIDLAARLAA